MQKISSNPNEMPDFGDLTNLSAEKLQELETVLTSILALPVARETYAQIIDGNPIRGPRAVHINASTSLVSDNTKPSDRAMQLYEEFRTAFAPQGLRIDLKLAQSYQDALPGSREHLLRLLDIAAASLHTLAGMMYTSFHPDTNIRPPEPPEGHYWQFRGTDHFYVNFFHSNYRRLKDFPFGLLNVVGYWAEAELFGGVVLFERVESGSEVINAFLHPQATAHAFQLSEKQLKSFVNLGIAGDVAKIAGAETVLPFAKEPDARTELTFIRLGEAPLRIYKNEYDKPPVSHVPLCSGCVRRPDERFEKAMRIVEEKGWDRKARTYPALFQDRPSLRDAYSAGDGAASSSNNESPVADKKGQ